MDTYRLVCAECSELFETSRPDALTCSGACRQRRYMRRRDHRAALSALASVLGERRAEEILAAREDLLA